MTTSEASLARKIGGGPRVAGVPGPAEQRTALTATTGDIRGAGGEVFIAAASVGAYTMADPASNAVAVRIEDRSGKAHTVTLRNGTVYTFNGTVGSYLILMASPAGDTWVTDTMVGVTVA